MSEQHHCQSVQRATYEAGLARRRYDEVDPANRLVAAELERSWEAALKSQWKKEESLNRYRQQSPSALSNEERSLIMALANDFRNLWDSECASNVDRQNLIRILIDRIEVDSINGTERLSVAIHWSGGFTSHHESRRRVQSFDDLEDSEALNRRTQELYNAGYPREAMVAQLNAEGFRPARNDEFTKTSIGAFMLMLRRRGLITDRPQLSTGFWRSATLADELNVGRSTLTHCPT